MKLYLIRFIKSAFIYLQLHRFFGFFTGAISNLLYLTKFSAWAYANRKIAFNDFVSKWDYTKRYPMYEWVIENYQLNVSVNYLEFGVASGHSFRWWLERNKNPESRFYGFDTFNGLPEDWGPYKKGSFSNDNQVPVVHDDRAAFYQGLFQQTLPGFIQNFDNVRKNIIMLDADLYSATLYTLTTLSPFLKKGDIIFFDEFVVPTHEFKAYLDFTQSHYIDLKLIAAANNYYFVAFQVN